MTSYQKLRVKNARLKADIRTLCLNPDSMEAEVIREKWKLVYAIDYLIFSLNNESTFDRNGIFNQIE